MPTTIMPPHRRKLKVINYVRLSEETTRQLDRLAKLEDLTRSDVIRAIVMNALREKSLAKRAA
jgi:predicted transcriptional regulator